MRQEVFGQPLALRAPQDFSFVLRYGTPFAVLPRPDSGTVCFGVEGPQYGRLFIKFAGAPLADAALSPAQAVTALRRAMPIYQTLYPHPALIKLQGHGETAGGYAAVYRWAEGVSLREPAGRAQLLRQPLLSRLRLIDPVLDFHAYALAQGYLAVDFYDGSLIADFETGRIAICDIDLYRRLPAVNDRGRMYGSSRFLSPEEYELHAPLDELTTQYTMGALAFFFFAAESSRERADWTAGEALYQVAARACSEERSGRYPSYREFLSAWRRGVATVTA